MSNSPLDSRTVAQIEDLFLRARIIVDGALTGLHRSRIRGSSVDFAEHKEYSPGDDIRFLDWRAYGKANRFLIKLFEQEAQLVTHLILDSSGSMGYKNSRDKISKLEYATSFQAALAYLFSRQRDRVGIYSFGNEETSLFHPPGSRGSSLQTIFSLFEKIQGQGPSGSESPLKVLDRLARRIRKKKHFICLSSDLFSHDNNYFEIIESLAAAGHEIVVCQILDDDEIEFPFSNVSIFSSLETKNEMCVNPRKIQKTYKKRLHTFIQEIKIKCENAGIHYQLINTKTPLEESLRAFISRGRR